MNVCLLFVYLIFFFCILLLSIHVMKNNLVLSIVSFDGYFSMGSEIL